MYKKRLGTSGISGQLYETKLISLLYFRAIHNYHIEEFQLNSNMDNIGAFDDICFKAKVKGFNKPVAVFIQAKHRENVKIKLQLDWATYFNSYIKIRQQFRYSNDDLFFKGAFDETECLFVLYTTAKFELCDDSVESDFAAKLNDLDDWVDSDFAAKLNDLISTGGGTSMINKHENIFKYLTKKTVKDQITSLAERIAWFIYERNYDKILMDELVLLYHVVLAQKVFDVSEIEPLQSKDTSRHRIASFRQDFFDNSEECVTLFRDTLYIAIIQKNNPELLTHKQHFLSVEPQVALAAKEILLSRRFIVPAAFGNKDLTISGSDVKVERRINHLTSRIINLLDKNKSSKIVTIDESLEHGFRRLDGGIAGAIGNIFVLDDDTKLMKITDNWESLGNHAKRLYTKLNSEIHKLHEYKFCIKVDKFPKLSFDCCGEYEENLVRDFLSKFVIYCNQANERGVERILKQEIAQHYQHQTVCADNVVSINQAHYFQINTDAIFSKYHDEIQNWWSQPGQSCSLTQKRDLFRRSIKHIVVDPLMSSINFSYKNKLQQYYNYTFTEDAVRSLNLQDQHCSTVIVSENSVLTVVKVMQHLKTRHHVVLDLEYIANLPLNDRNALRSELTNTNEARVLILVCDKIDSENRMKTLEDIAEAVGLKRTISITNQTSLHIVNKYFPAVDNTVHDKKLSLADLSKESQESVLETATATFSGVEIRLDLLLKGWPMTGARSIGAATASAAADKETEVENITTEESAESSSDGFLDANPTCEELPKTSAAICLSPTIDRNAATAGLCFKEIPEAKTEHVQYVHECYQFSFGIAKALSKLSEERGHEAMHKILHVVTNSARQPDSGDRETRNE